MNSFKLVQYTLDFGSNAIKNSKYHYCAFVFKNVSGHHFLIITMKIVITVCCFLCFRLWADCCADVAA